MSRIFARSAAGGGALSVTVNNVTKSTAGVVASGFVETVQLPNTTITGGTPPYDILWEYVSGSLTIGISDPNALNPTWFGEVTEDVPETGTWKVTITDAALDEAEDEATITLIWINIG